MEGDNDACADPAIRAVLDDLAKRLDANRPGNIGFPSAIDVDFGPVTPLFRYHMLNNLGDPFVEGAVPHHTKDLERDVVTFVADLMRAPAEDRWGYVTSGAGEGNLYALHLARGLHPDAVVYHSEAAHFSVDKAVALLGMPSVVVRADEAGRMNYHDLATQVAPNRDRAAVVVANIGTTMTEAVDDVRRITEVLDSLAIRRRFVHADAALSGIPLALMDPHDRPGFDFADGADSIIVSGHKFLGTPVPCGVILARESHRVNLTRTGAYTGSPDTTITCSRSGHAALLLWYVIRLFGVDGLRSRAARAREVAVHAYRRLTEIGWAASYNPPGFTVVLATPPPVVTDRWMLASSNGRSHIVCAPGITREQIDRFVADLEGAKPTLVPSPRRAPGLRGATPAQVA